MNPYRLDRFIEAQAPAYVASLRELEAGRKRTHWMWFIFPQLRGLGSSSAAGFYGISSIDEAKAYLEHPVLGERLRLCTHAVLKHPGTPLTSIFGSPDDMKFRSSMTLFAHAANRTSIFRDALDRMCDGVGDPQTLSLLKL